MKVDPLARVKQGVLEGNNVSAVETMVAMIAAARQFEQQIRMLQTAEQKEQAATKLQSTGASCSRSAIQRIGAAGSARLARTFFPRRAAPRRSRLTVRRGC